MSLTPWGPTGYVTYKRTYARRLSEDVNSPTEEFPQTVERVVTACRTQLKVGFSEQEEQELRDTMLRLKGIVAGRFLWQLGTSTVDRLGLFSLQNCAGVVVDKPVRPFAWTADALMLGSGVGFNIQKEHVYSIPPLKRAVSITRQDNASADFIVPDTREGWVKLFELTLEAHFKTGRGFTYSTQLIRGKGAPIKGFGGYASGPEELCWGVTQISQILNRRAKKKLNPVDALDVMNIIGYVVVAGNVRRSAQLAIGDMDDLQYLRAKRWDLGNIPNWRATSNNSVVCNEFGRLPEQFWEGYQGNGEPYGLINLRLAREVGRTGETQYPDRDVMIFNPCSEQSLANHETCALGEVYLPNISTEDELKKVTTLLYRVIKHSLALPCHSPETQAVVHKHMRMGIGITGYMQASGDQKSWLRGTYEYLREFDLKYSAKHRWNPSIKLCTVKPSGTLSLLAGVTPGCHPGYAQHFIRRIRIAANSPLVELVKRHGFHVEPQVNFDDSQNMNTLVASFPSKYPEGTKLACEVSAIDQLETVKELQANWSDNAVSCTIYYQRNELPTIQSWLSKNYDQSIKACSFLLHSEHGFKQAPYEEISEEEYQEMASRTVPITGLSSDSTELLDADCEGGACPVR